MRKKITEMYRAFRRKYGNHKPNRAIVKMYWEDDPETIIRDVVALKTYDITPDDDEEVLFYAGGLKGLLDLTKPNNGSDFVITEVVQFYREIAN